MYTIVTIAPAPQPLKPRKLQVVWPDFGVGQPFGTAMRNPFSRGTQADWPRWFHLLDSWPEGDKVEQVEKAYKELDAVLRKASVSQIGGFRPPDDRITSWFGGRGVGRAGEALPKQNGRDMFCLLQVKVAELPFIPPELGETRFLVVFFSRDQIPFNQPHGDGWLIREYISLDGLQPLPESSEPEIVRDFPIKWSLVEDDAPDWENAWELVDLTPINETDGADERFFYEYKRYQNTKFGGFPCCIQHGADLEGYVFQIGSEEKPGWMWVDNGIAHFNKVEYGEWVFDCQFF